MEGKLFVRWEEVVVSNDKGRRVVHYYLKDAGGGSELAVVGREKSVRHLSYAVPNHFLRSQLHSSSPSSTSSPSSFNLKWRSRREVIDWLSSLVSDSVSYGSSPMADRFSDDEDAEPTDIPTSKGLSSGKMGHHSKEFSWLGSAWKCRKRRKHYRSFHRSGITISVHDFVYVMAEENKRLVAYVEDLYEDLRANNMVVVRWFHKVDEVGIILPPDVNDREIFFSLCLQDFSVECIDGLAAVLSVQDFDKFQSELRHRHSSWEPYLCRRQIDNDDVKPFDITQVQGYWSQELLRSIYSPSLKLRLKITTGGSTSSLVNGDGNSSGVPKRNHRLNSVGGDFNSLGMVRNINKSRSLGVGSKAERNVSSTTSAPHLLRKELLKHNLHQQQQQQQQQLAPGCHVEVLSQDSGIRGCWFRCVVLKKHWDKVKVRYQDVQNAEETGNLEEWVLASRVASTDKLGIRMCGRPVVRPHPSPHRGKVSGSFDVGSVVDAWWHDGWWEGIVIHKVSDGKIHVYFPGEQRVSIFGLGDLRQSQDWVGNKWNHLKDRPYIASSLLPDITDRETTPHRHVSSDGQIPLQASVSKVKVEADISCSLPEEKAASKPLSDIEPSSVEQEEGYRPNLTEICQLLDGLRWCSSRKRRRGSESVGKEDRGSGYKRHCAGSGSSSSSREEDSDPCGLGFSIPKPLTAADHENCKIGGDPLFGSPMALCSSLVMSR